MKFVQNHIPGCYEIQFPVFSDQRGRFVKTVSASKFAEHGLETTFAETFFTVSEAKVLRGMHFQLPPADHAKLVYCSAGRILDVCLDLRIDSPTYGHHSVTELSSEKSNGVYMPTGIAHGFYVLEAPAVTVYHVTTEHNAALDTGIAWNSFGMEWPDLTPMISTRDSIWPSFATFTSPLQIRKPCHHRPHTRSKVTDKRSLIVGATGQLGTQLRRLLPTAISTAREPRPGWLTVDLQQIADYPHLAEQVILRMNIDAVYCAGAMTYVDGCEANKDLAVQTNCVAPAILAAIAARLGAAFVYYSTDYVFDGTDGPYAENANPNPINVYGRSKWIGEKAVTKACPEALIIRTTGVYGPDQRGKNFLYGLRKTLKSGKVMTVPSDQIATPTYNVDLAKASIALVRVKASGVFNVTGPDLVSRLEFAKRAAVTMGLDSSLVAGMTTTELGQIAPRPLRAGLRLDKLKDALPEVHMRGIEECVGEWNQLLATY